MTNAAKLIDFKKENNALGEYLSLEWTIQDLDNRNMPLRTPIFTWNKEKFYFEVFYGETNKFYYINLLSTLDVILRKLLKTSVDSNLTFKYSMSVYYSDMTLYIKNKSVKPLDLAEFSSESCLIIHSRFYNENGFGTDHLRKMSSPKTLIFKCQMNFFGHLLSPSAYQNAIHSLNHLQKFNGDLWSLYQSGTLSDVTFQVSDKTLKSHKLVLVAHSPVFKRMLEQDFLESKTGVIAISDYEPDVFESFLKFLYTGEVEEKSLSNFKQLYSLADKYDVQTLKEECIEILTDSSLNEEQIYEILQMSQEYSDDVLKTAAKSFLADHLERK